MSKYKASNAVYYGVLPAVYLTCYQYAQNFLSCCRLYTAQVQKGKQPANVNAKLTKE